MNKFWDITEFGPAHTNEVLLGTDVADKLSVHVGQSITVGANEKNTANGTILDTDGTRMRIVGIVSTGGREDSMVVKHARYASEQLTGEVRCGRYRILIASQWCGLNQAREQH